MYNPWDIFNTMYRNSVDMLNSVKELYDFGVITLSKLEKIIYGAFGVPSRSRPRAGGGGGVRVRQIVRPAKIPAVLQKNSSIHTAHKKYRGPG